MKVTTISASVRFSKALGDGQHKTVELGAEAVVASLTEDWQEAQASLYAELSQQLKALWGNGNGNGHHAPDGAVAAAEPQTEPEQAQKTPAHWCSDHGKAFNRFEKEGKVWYSHKGPDGHWCREK